LPSAREQAGRAKESTSERERNDWRTAGVREIDFIGKWKNARTKAVGKELMVWRQILPLRNKSNSIYEDQGET
jgi:hypothetical protein